MTDKLLVLVLATAMAPAAFGGDGSLIDPDSYRAVAADRRAYRVGDALTIVVVESARAESRAATDADRRYQIQASGQDTANAAQVGLDVNANSDNNGSTARQGRITAQIAATVVAVEPNGQLEVRGEQEILINGEQQRIAVSGRVRAEDITAANAVLSSRLADAKIEFTGDGVVDDAQKHGLVYRLMRWLGVV